MIDEKADSPVWTPHLLRVGNRLVSILDTEDGTPSRRFAEMLVEGGARRLEQNGDANLDLRIVIRGAPVSTASRRRAEVLEETADLILGAARPAFARLFASACAPRVTD
ncbi:MAG: hypothetical protein HKN10_05470 [Myxococcales bacterium]|nr:hypothetical protein [Myxococcales bacterium]